MDGWLDPAEPFEAALAEEDIWAGYDAEEVRTALRERTGVLTEREAEESMAAIYRWREKGSRPAE